MLAGFGRSAPLSRIGPGIAVLTTVAVVSCLVTIPAWHLGKQREDERCFLRTYRIPYDSEAYVSTCGEYATNSSAPNDVVFVGDSTCLTGLRTRQLELLTGLSAYNLGTYGMIGIEGFTVLMQAYLDHHPAPRLVVLCVRRGELNSTVKARDPSRERRASRSHSITDRFLWSYGKAGKYPRPSESDPWKYFISQGLLSVIGEFSGGQRHFLSTPAWSLGGRSYDSFRDSLGESKGFISLGDKSNPLPTEPPQESPGVPPFADGSVADDARSVSPEFDAGVRSLAQAVADRGALLMIRLTPESQSCSPEQFEEICGWFDQLESDCLNVTCDRPVLLSFGREYFVDGNHCNLRGADKFTALVAANVTRMFQTGVDSRSVNSAPRRTTADLGPAAE